VVHEFTAIPGVKEDVTDIILNLKQVRLKLHEGESDVIRLEANKEGVVTAGDLKTTSRVEVVNPDHVIATLGKGAKLNADLTVKMGKGYVAAEFNKQEGDSIGTIPIDASFSPITKCNYTVSNARVGRRTDYDRLAIEIWTNGAVKPEDAIAYAAKIIKEQTTVFINFDETIEPQEEEMGYLGDETSKLNENLYRRVEELELSVRSANCLQNANIKYIGELCQRSEGEMLRTKNFGRKSLNEIKEILASMGISLGMKLDGFDVKDAEKFRPKDIE